MVNVKRIIFKILLVLITLNFIFAIENVSHAGMWDKIMDSAKNFVSIGENAANSGSLVIDPPNGAGANITIGTPNGVEIKGIMNNIYDIIFPLGVAATVIIGGILGIKFMLASAEEKAKLKESLVPYVAGCAVIYGAFGIWKLAITIFSQMG